MREVIQIVEDKKAIHTIFRNQLRDSSQYSWARIFRRLFSKRCTFWSKSGTKSLVRRYQAKFAKVQNLGEGEIVNIRFRLF